MMVLSGMVLLAAAADWAAMAGKPVDITPWAWEYRADRNVQRAPEAYFIPRRLERQDKVYRTAPQELPPDQLKSVFYDLRDMLKPFPPKPKAKLAAGLLWTGGLVDYRIELHWPKPPPSPDSVEVRVYPTSFGWFGWTVDKVLTDPVISQDRRTWTYKSDPTEVMDSSYNARVRAATEMVAVFSDNAAIPSVHVYGPSVGNWTREDVEIEWLSGRDVQPRMETYVAKAGPLSRLSGGRNGVSLPLLVAPDSRPGLDSRVTVFGPGGGFTVAIKDLDKGPVYIPRQGVVVTKAGSGLTAAEFVAKLAAKKAKSLRERTREHREAVSWDEVMREVRLWTCPPGTELKPYPKMAEPAVQVELPDPGWTNAWRAVSNQLRGQNMWGGLAFEVGRVAHEMDMAGLHEEADRVYKHFLDSPGVKCDGDYLDGAGSLEWAANMRHDMGYMHDGTHPSTGRLLFAMADRYFLTGDRQWFQSKLKRLQAAADWIIRQRTQYMKDVPNRDKLLVAGLMPPQMLGDYALPASDWHWYYVDNALSLQALERFADALEDFNPAAAKKYRAEATAFRKDLRRVIDREAVYAPVRLGQDGAYHSFLPRMAYSRGLTGPQFGAPQFPDCDKFVGALPLAEPFSALDAADPRMMDTLDMMEEMGTSSEAIRKAEQDRRAKGLPTSDAWFWNCYVILPKASHNANIYLLQDDIQSFLRYWTNAYASMVGADGKLWEAWHLGTYDDCAAPDNGTAGWFMENFRDMLVMEIGNDLWLARGTPRAWLEQGKRIAVRNAPTYYGDVAYDIVSDVEHGSISATVDVPTRRKLHSVVLHLRHPEAKRITSVTVNGKPWSKFDAAKETVTLTGLSGTALVEARY